MKKLITLFLSVCIIFAVSCASGLDADASRSGTSNPAATLNPGQDGSQTGLSAVAAFINKYAGVYYSAGEHTYNEHMIGRLVTNDGFKVDYKFRDGKIYKLNNINQATELIVEPVDAVLPSENKLQLRHADKGEILVLNMTEEGLESYTSYMLVKVSDDVLIKNEGVGEREESLIPYKGTYNSIAEDNKIENYIAIGEDGTVYFHDASVTVASGRVGFTEGEHGGLTVLEAHNKYGALRKIIFKFNEGREGEAVYRRYSIDGQNRDETYIGICEVTTDFIEDLPIRDAVYQTEDFKILAGNGSGRNFAPTKLQGVSIKINEPTAANATDGLPHHVTLEGAVCIGGEIGDRWTQGKDMAKYDQVGHVSIRIGNELHVMGRYNAVFTFSDDYRTLTYNGKTLTLASGEIKSTAKKTYRRK